MPVCGRCQNTGSDCQYVRSRRGLRSKPGKDLPDLADDSLPLFTGVDDPLSDLFSASAMADLEVFAWNSTGDIGANGFQPSQSMFPALSTPTPQALDIRDIPNGDDAVVFSMSQPDNLAQDLAYEPMIQLYYQGFHRSHPFLLPRKALNSPLARRIPESTISIMRYIGAHYHPDPAFREIFRHPAYAGLADVTVFPGFRVQNMLLLAIVEHAQGNEETAQQTIQTAITLALEVGMNRDPFATQNAWGSPLLEESWRRTYWELYVINGMLAAMRDQKPFVLHSQVAEVGLPCEEGNYNSCNMVCPPTSS